MLPPEIVSMKTESNARRWCNMKGYKYLSFGAWDVYYQIPEQIGEMRYSSLAGKYIQKYSSINWLEVIKDLKEKEDSAPESLDK